MRNWGEFAFNPKRVALIGASAQKGKVGHLLLHNLLDGYPGVVAPVHPEQAEIMGRRAYPRIQDVPGPVDLAILALPAEACTDAMRGCAEAGVRSALVVSGGFAETGPEGKTRQDEMIAVARAAGIRVVGPNCFGLCNCNVGLNASLGRGLPLRGGDISLVTQSGAYGMATFSLGLERKLAFAKVLSVGNKADLRDHEIVDYFADDPDTRVLCLFLESVVGGRAFYESLRRAARTTFVVVAKTGRSVGGRRAAASHTAALTASDTAFTTAVRQAGAILAGSGQEMLDIAEGLSRQPLPQGRRVGIITSSGGTGVELTDLCERHGLVVPELGERTKKRIRAVIPPYASAANPIDVTILPARYPFMFSKSVEALYESEDIDIVMPILLQRSALMRENVEAVRDAVLRHQREKGGRKPAYVCWVTEREGTANQAILQEAGIPVYDWPERTARTVAAIADHAEAKATWEERAGRLSPSPARAREKAAAVLARAREEGRTVLLEPEVKGMVAAYGATVPREHTVRTAEEARAAAESLGGPVVMKIVSPDIAHKSDVGGVRVGVAAPRAGLAFAELVAKAREARPEARILGVSVQETATGIEVIAGAVRDPDFGPILMFGLGGVFVEVLKDVAYRLLPANDGEFLTMLHEIRGFPLLEGARGGAPANLDSLLRVLRAVSWLMADFPEVSELDLNPIFAGPMEATVADARAVLAGETE